MSEPGRMEVPTEFLHKVLDERDLLSTALIRIVEIGRTDYEAREDDEDGPATICALCAMGLDEHDEDCLIGVAKIALVMSRAKRAGSGTP